MDIPGMCGELKRPACVHAWEVNIAGSGNTSVPQALHVYMGTVQGVNIAGSQIIVIMFFIRIWTI